MHSACSKRTWHLEFVWRIWRESFMSVMAFRRFVVFSRKSLLLLLLVIPRRGPSSFSPQFSRSPTLDPGVRPSPLSFSARSGRRDLPDPGLFLRLLTGQELADSLHDMSKLVLHSDSLPTGPVQVTMWPCYISF